MREPTLEEARQEIQGMLDESEKRRNGDLQSTALLLADGESSGLRKALRALEPKPDQPLDVICTALAPYDARAHLLAQVVINTLLTTGYRIVHESEVK